ncbi:response regulator, partial [bacterium]|nr:response regulator [bacterium]
MSRYRILVVDDDEEIRRVLKLTLSTRYEVVEACDGLDALSKLEDYEPDFAIIDIMMPLMDGFQLCEAIRRHKSFKVMQVMFLSAHGS